MPEFPESDLRRSVMKIAAVLAPTLLILLAILHSLVPKHISLDWQTVALLVLGVVLVFFPMHEIAGMIQSLEIGNVKILLRARDKLQEITTKAEIELADKESQAVGNSDSIEIVEGKQVADSKLGHGGEPTESIDRDRVETQPRRENNGVEGKLKQPVSKPANDSFASEFEPLLKVKGEVQQLEVVDSKAALIRLAMSIEATVVTLASKVPHNRRTHPVIFSKALLTLLQAKLVPYTLADGLAQFMNLRNKVLHLHVKEPIEDEVIRSAIDNGLSLLMLLLVVASRFNVDPTDGETVSLV